MSTNPLNVLPLPMHRGALVLEQPGSVIVVNQNTTLYKVLGTPHRRVRVIHEVVAATLCCLLIFLFCILLPPTCVKSCQPADNTAPTSISIRQSTRAASFYLHPCACLFHTVPRALFDVGPIETKPTHTQLRPASNATLLSMPAGSPPFSAQRVCDPMSATRRQKRLHNIHDR